LWTHPPAMVCQHLLLKAFVYRVKLKGSGLFRNKGPARQG
jgi:hypothetical protein